MSHKIRLATIGTSVISDNLLQAAAQIDAIEYVGTLSRSEDTARAFTERHGGTTPFTSLEELAASDAVDAVYVASPNALHYEQALACIRGNKHVLVEKAMCANRYEAEELFAAASLHEVVALEAMRPVHDPGWATMLAALPRLGQLRRASLRYGKYSSRYDDVLAGRHTNIFDARMASGALMDLGVYCVEPMVAAFGAPSRVMAAPVLVGTQDSKLTGGAIDGAGSVLCAYDRGAESFVVELAYSKISQDLLPCQVEGELGTLTIDAVNVPQHATLRLRGSVTRGAATAASANGAAEELPMTPCENSMVYELEDFARLIAGEPVATMWGELSARDALARFRDVTLASLSVTDEIRRQAGITFPADAKQRA